MKGRPIRGLIGGFILGIFVDIDLVFGGVVKLESVVLTILPIALLVIGLGLGLWAPVGRWRLQKREPLPPSVPEKFADAATPAEAPPMPEEPTPPPPPPPAFPEDTPPI